MHAGTIQEIGTIVRMKSESTVTLTDHAKSKNIRFARIKLSFRLILRCPCFHFINLYELRRKGRKRKKINEKKKNEWKSVQQTKSHKRSQ